MVNGVTFEAESWDTFFAMLNDDERASLEHSGLTATEQLLLQGVESVVNFFSLRPLLKGMLGDIMASKMEDTRPVTFDDFRTSLNEGEKGQMVSQGVFLDPGRERGGEGGYPATSCRSCRMMWYPS